MGWDVHFFRRTPGADPEDAEVHLPLGSRDELEVKLVPLLGPPSPRVPGYWVVNRDGCELRVAVHDEEDPIVCVSAGVYGDGDPFPTLRALARALECEALDMVRLELVNLDAGRSAGLDEQRQAEGLFAQIVGRIRH
jgi:hypothetical protein